MSDILASIRRIISADPDAAVAAPTATDASGEAATPEAPASEPAGAALAAADAADAAAPVDAADRDRETLVAAPAAPAAKPVAEPSMEDILASIRRIISEDGEPGRPADARPVDAQPEDARPPRPAAVRSARDAALRENAPARPSRARTSRAQPPRAEPSMEDILASIRRIISEDGEPGRPADARPVDARPHAAPTLSEEECLAAEWAALADADDDPVGPGVCTRVLNQDEIDSLLGWSEQDEEERRDGVYALINSAPVGSERLPMLDAVIDRLGRTLTTSMRDLTGDNVEVTIDPLATVRLGDHLNDIPLPAMLGVLRLEEWGGAVLAVTDSALIYSVVDVMLGGRRGTAAMRIEGRPYTAVEHALMSQVFAAVAADLAAAFAPISPVTARLERVETNPRFAIVARAGSVCTVVRLRLDMEDRGGRLDLIVPHGTLEPVRELLTQAYMGERFGRDALWDGHLRAVLRDVPLPLRAELGRFPARLSDTLAWRPGTLIDLGVAADGARARLTLPGRAVVSGRFGALDGRWAVTAERLLIDGEADGAAPRHPAPVALRAVTPTQDAQTQDITMTDKTPADNAAGSGASGPETIERGLDAILDVDVTVSAVLGATEMRVGNLLKLGRGAVIELDRKVGEAIDVCVNNRPVARAEIVVIEGRLGIMLTEMTGRP